MKKIITLFLLCLLFSSCEEEGTLTYDGSNSAVLSSDAVLRYRGIFQPTAGISVEGNVELYSDNGQWKLQLNGFSITSGPDLKIYLSKTASPDEFINLGNLNSTTVYALPFEVDFNQYQYVLIHCQQYNHLFAIAPLQQI